MRFVAFILCVLLSACGPTHLPDSVDKSPEATYLHDMVTKLAAHDYAALEQSAIPELAGTNMRGDLERMSTLLPADTVKKIELLELTVTTRSDKPRVATIAEQYVFASAKPVVMSAQLVGEPGNFRVARFYIEPLPAPLDEIHAFTLKGKGLVHYIFLVLVPLAFLVSVYAFIRCLLTPRLKRKWLWAIFIVIGFGAFKLNWTTGAVTHQLLFIQLLSAGAIRVMPGPWLLSFAIPVGAIWFLLKRRLMLRDVQEAAVAPSEAQSQAPTN